MAGAQMYTGDLFLGGAHHLRKKGHHLFGGQTTVLFGGATFFWAEPTQSDVQRIKDTVALQT